MFSEKTEAGLDSMYNPLVYLMNAQESGEYSTLTLDGKRKWLRQFWAKRNPTPGGDRNASMDQYYARIRDAETKFREGGASATPGWRTERGKITMIETIASPMGRSAETSVPKTRSSTIKRDGDADRLTLGEVGLRGLVDVVRDRRLPGHAHREAARVAR